MVRGNRSQPPANKLLRTNVPQTRRTGPAGGQDASPAHQPSAVSLSNEPLRWPYLPPANTGAAIAGSPGATGTLPLPTVSGLMPCGAVSAEITYSG